VTERDQTYLKKSLFEHLEEVRHGLRVISPLGPGSRDCCVDDHGMCCSCRTSLNSTLVCRSVGDLYPFICHNDREGQNWWCLRKTFSNSTPIPSVINGHSERTGAVKRRMRPLAMFYPSPQPKVYRCQRMTALSARLRKPSHGVIMIVVCGCMRRTRDR